MNIDSFKKFIIILTTVFLTGVLAGKISGEYILKSALRGDVNLFTFLFSQSQNFIDMFYLLNSQMDYKRLEGYYSYRESGYADLDFLYERYKAENSWILKKAILWSANGSSEQEKLVDFYDKIYKISTEEERVLIKDKINKTGDK